MSKMLKIDPNHIKKAAKLYPEAEEILHRLFPEAFPELWSIKHGMILTTRSGNDHYLVQCYGGGEAYYLYPFEPGRGRIRWEDLTLNQQRAYRPYLGTIYVEGALHTFTHCKQNT